MGNNLDKAACYLSDFDSWLWFRITIIMPKSHLRTIKFEPLYFSVRHGIKKNTLRWFNELPGLKTTILWWSNNALGKQFLTLSKKSRNLGFSPHRKCFKSVCMHTQLLSHVQVFATPWTVAHQVPRSVEFFRQEYWSRLPFPIPGVLNVEEYRKEKSFLQLLSIVNLCQHLYSFF